MLLFQTFGGASIESISSPFSQISVDKNCSKGEKLSEIWLKGGVPFVGLCPDISK